MTKKASDLGGQRARATQHGVEVGGASALALLVISFAPAGMLDPFQAATAASVLTGVFSMIAKVLRDRGILPEVAKSALVLILAGGLGGCALTLGTIEPQEFTAAQGETVIACEIKGLSLAFGDGGTCATVEGGKISQAAADLLGGVFNGVRGILAGIFGGPAAAAAVSAGG